MRTYALFKKEKGLERYLTDIKNISVRTKVTKFRLSNHKLMIEVGRHQGIEDEKQRFCPFCPQDVENESHFLFSCPVYTFQRNTLLDPITRTYPYFSNLPMSLKLEFVMSYMDQNVCNYIANASDIREFLVSKPKRVN